MTAGSDFAQQSPRPVQHYRGIYALFYATEFDGSLDRHKRLAFRCPDCTLSA